MKKQIATAIVAAQALLWLGYPSLAQQTQTISNSDKQYLIKDASGSAYEFQVAELGVQKAARPITQQYALRLLDDHAKFNAQLMQLANRKRITLPIEPSSQDKSRLKRLMQLNGTAFDNAFAKEMIRINQEDISDSKQEANRTKDPDIQAFLNQFASTDQEHL